MDDAAAITKVCSRWDSDSRPNDALKGQQGTTRGYEIDPRCDSPTSKCPICLCEIDNPAYADQCFHSFCFVCLVEWSKVKAVCPLCKQTFKTIAHDVRSYGDFKELVVVSKDEREDRTTTLWQSQLRAIEGLRDRLDASRQRWSAATAARLDASSSRHRYGYGLSEFSPLPLLRQEATDDRRALDFSRASFPPPERDGLGLPAHAEDEGRFRYRTTLTRDYRDVLRRLEERRLTDLLRSPALRTAMEQVPFMFSDTARRAVYSSGLDVQDVDVDATGGASALRRHGYSCVAPHFFSANPTSKIRLFPWLNRELGLLVDTTSARLADVERRILTSLDTTPMGSPQFESLLRADLGRHCEKFVRELYCFARSAPFTVAEYDGRVVYGTGMYGDIWSEYWTARSRNGAVARSGGGGVVVSGECEHTTTRRDTENASRRLTRLGRMFGSLFGAPVTSTLSVAARTTPSVIPLPGRSSLVPGPSGTGAERNRTEEINLLSDDDGDNVSISDDGDVEIVGEDKAFEARTPISISSSGDEASDDVVHLRTIGHERNELGEASNVDNTNEISVERFQDSLSVGSSSSLRIILLSDNPDSDDDDDNGAEDSSLFSGNVCELRRNGERGGADESEGDPRGRKRRSRKRSSGGSFEESQSGREGSDRRGGNGGSELESRKGEMSENRKRFQSTEKIPFRGRRSDGDVSTIRDLIRRSESDRMMSDVGDWIADGEDERIAGTSGFGNETMTRRTWEDCGREVIADDDDDDDDDDDGCFRYKRLRSQLGASFLTDRWRFSEVRNGADERSDDVSARSDGRSGTAERREDGGDRSDNEAERRRGIRRNEEEHERNGRKKKGHRRRERKNKEEEDEDDDGLRGVRVARESRSESESSETLGSDKLLSIIFSFI